MVPVSVRHLLRTTPTVAPIPHRALLYLSGSQATQFLNAILASTVVSPPRGPFFSALLHAQGRVLYDLFVYPKKNERGHDGYLIEYDPRPSEALPLHLTLKRFILRSKVKIEDVSDQYDVWAIWGSERMRELDAPRQWIWSQSRIGEPQWAATDRWPWSVPGDERIMLHDRRTISMGARLLVRKGDKPHETATHDIVRTHDYTLHRILHGVPEGIIDIPSLQAFPMESNLDVMGGLDFRKGCYIGQELTVRTYHTGVLRKRILPVMICDDKGALAPDSAVVLNNEILPVYSDNLPSKMPKLRGYGKMLMAMQGVGLALMRLEQVEMAEKGLLEFQADLGDENESSDFPNTRYKVSHWLPAWWPK